PARRRRRRPRPGRARDRTARRPHPRLHRRRPARRAPRRSPRLRRDGDHRVPLPRGHLRRTSAVERPARSAAALGPVPAALPRLTPRRSTRMTRLNHPRTLLVVLILPLLVVGLGMWALSGRVDRLDAVPAAVVNLDEGAEMEDADGEVQQVPLGRMLAGALTQ